MYMEFDSALKGAPVTNEELGHSGKNLQDFSSRLRVVQAELVSGPSHLNIPPLNLEVSVANVAKLNRSLRQKAARLGYLYAVLGHNFAALREAQELLEHQSKEIRGLRGNLAARSHEVETLQAHLAASSLAL